MSDIKLIEGDFIAPQGRYALVAARFNEFVVDQLVSGAIDALRRHGIPATAIELFKVPGAYEIPLVVKKLAVSGRYQGIITLGAVIRGSTAHFEYVAGPCASALASLATDTGVPIGFGVLTVESIEQAIERSGTKAGNKGAEAALTVLELASLLNKIDEHASHE